MTTNSSKRHFGFTLIEALISIAIIGVLTSMVITVYRNVSQDTRDVVGRQQQAAVQNAINNWVTAESKNNSIAGLRKLYNDSGKSLARLELVHNYLDQGTYAHFKEHSKEDQIRSAALEKLGKYLSLPDWKENSYPQVDLGS